MSRVNTKPLVVIESPFSGDVKANKSYARKALKDSLLLGEAPIASHLLHTQVLDDTDDQQRHMGVTAGWAWIEVCDLVAFYADRGMSMGMLGAMRVAVAAGKPVEVRYLYRRGGGKAARGEGAAETGPNSPAAPIDPYTGEKLDPSSA